jgi:hypothetical protein
MPCGMYAAIVVGVPAKVIRFRWDQEKIDHHEAILYGPVDIAGTRT